MIESHKHYLPAAGHDMLLPLYDAITKVLGLERSRQWLLDQADLEAGHTILDVGCGTGSLLVLLKHRYPEVDAAGVDPDPKALRRARRKAERAGVALRLDEAYAASLPYPEDVFDRVMSSFMLHHLDDKAAMLAEIRRVLKPGGRLELVDFGGLEDAGHRRFTHWLPFRHRLGDNAEKHIVALMTETGFENARIVQRRSMPLGPIVFYQATAR